MYRPYLERGKEAARRFCHKAWLLELRTSPGGMTQTTIDDANGRMASVANVLGTFTNTYDDVGGPLTQITHTGANAGFDTAFTYLGTDFNRALASITSKKPGGATVGKHSYTYNPLGNISTWKREAPLANPSGGTSQFQSTVFYDMADQVSSMVNAALPGSSVANTGNHYLYDLAGNLASKQVETSATGAIMTTYSHNNLNQITGIGGSGGMKQVIVRGQTNEPATVKVKSIVTGIASAWKDARMLEGNRFESDQDLATGANQLNIEAKDGSNNVSNYTYNLTLAAATSATPSYDAEGNLLSDGVRSYEWDRLSRLVKITWGGSPAKSTEYRYNALGQRSEQIEKSGTTETARYYYLYEGKDLLCRYTGGTAVANIDRQYLSQGEQRKSASAWSSYYYNRDHLGSIREVLKSDGTLVARYDYDPYGKRSAQYEANGYACDLGYTGHMNQQSGVAGQGEIVLTFFRAYDPLLGRWLSADPIGEVDGMNLYAYVRRNPLNAVDSYGLWTIGFGLTGQGGVGPGGGISGGIYIGHDPDCGIFDGWSSGLLGSGELGLQTPGAGITGFASVSDANTVDQLRGMGWVAGGSGGVGLTGGVEFSGGFNTDSRGFPTGGNGVQGMQISGGVGGWGPLPGEINAGISETFGPTFGAKGSGCP
jgi:RHS repeat-associated protein